MGEPTSFSKLCTFMSYKSSSMMMGVFFCSACVFQQKKNAHITCSHTFCPKFPLKSQNLNFFLVKMSSHKKRRHASSSSIENKDSSKKRAKKYTFTDFERIHEKYEKGKELGEGTFGKVYDGVVKATRERVAIKKIKVQLGYRDGLHPTALREIKYLREISRSRMRTLSNCTTRIKEVRVCISCSSTV